MDIKAVLHNFRTKGISKTLKIRKERKIKKEKVERIYVLLGKLNETLKEAITDNDISTELQIESLENIIERVIEAITDNDISTELQIESLENIIERVIEAITDNDISTELRDRAFEVIREKESTKGYKTYIKRKYIKEILPNVYNEYSTMPIENKMVFMQPRKELNEDYVYMINYIKSEGTYEPILFELCREDSVTLYYKNAIKWIKSMATAKACFVQESNDLMGYLDIRKETKIVQLWHGCGILKKIGLSTAGMNKFKSVKTYEEFPEYNKYDIVTIASPELSWVFEEFMGIKKEEGIISPIGVSRTDEFFDETYIKNCYDKIHQKVPASQEKKIILYAPTYRGVDPGRVAPDAIDIESFAEALGDDYILIIKQHQTVKNVPEIPEQYRDKFAYDMTRGKGMNINELMTVADICISDYSSLVFEYALFERPIIFFAFDLEDYIDNRGLYYEFEEITPGPVCRTTQEMIDYIKDIENLFNRQEIIDFKNKFMSACDGKSTERIFEFARQ